MGEQRHSLRRTDLDEEGKGVITKKPERQNEGQAGSVQSAPCLRKEEERMDETIMSCDRCGRQKHHTFWAIHGFLDPDGDPIDLCVLCMIVLSQYKTLVDNWGDRTPPLGKINQLLV